MSKSLGTGIDPLDEIDAPRRRRGALRPARDVLDPGRASTPARRSSRASAWRTSCSTPRATCCSTSQEVERRAAAADGLRPLDPVAAAGGEGRVRRQHRPLRLLQGRARPLRLRLRRAVRLVPRVHQGPRVRRGPLGDDAPRPARDARARAPDDPVRHRGAVGPRARQRGAARDGAHHRRPTRPCATRPPRPRWPPSSRRCRRCARGATRRASSPARCCPRASTGSTAPPTLVARMARLDLSSDGEPTATVPVPGGSVEIRAGDLVDREAEARKARRRARARAAGDRPRGGQARQRGLRRQGAARPRAGRARQARAPAPRARPAM